MAGYVAKTRLGLPVHEDREVHKGIVAAVATGATTIKEPGDKVTLKELREHGQDDDDIKRLVADGALEPEGGSS